MAEEVTEQAAEVEENLAENEEKTSKKGRKGLLKRLLTPKALAILVGLSILAHGVAFAVTRTGGSSASEDLGTEISLGEFRFEANPAEAGPISSAWFTLHIALLEHVDSAARDKLKARKFRVKQGIEELLRQAHGGDFDDPNLGELKRQLQEQVNETLGMRAIADVVITDLEITPRSQEEAVESASAAEKVPWKEEQPPS